MSSSQSYITGWDIGGAHIKAARCDHQGNILQVVEVACPLWRGIDHLKQAISQLQTELDNRHDIAAVTMTAELVDIFTDRQTGVQTILAVLLEYIPFNRCYIYAVDAEWLTPEDAVKNWPAVASQNWHATAHYTSQHVAEGLLIDIGSTTCDIIPFCAGAVMTQARTDFERQISRELVYTGAIRTPLIAFGNAAPFNEQDIGLAAEVFATTADCWVLLDKLLPQHILDESADGESWQKSDCQRRIARMLGTDAHLHLESQWLTLAEWFATQQIKLITQACERVLFDRNLSSTTPLVGAGIGRFIVKKCAKQLDRDYVDFSSIVHPSLKEPADHAPATAVALLAASHMA
jgi:probable H4MPT-linked C1 transfer pathway protein